MLRSMNQMRTVVRGLVTFAAGITVGLLAMAPACSAQTSHTEQTQAPASSAGHSQAASSNDAALNAKISAFLRNLYGWGPQYDLKLGTFKDAADPAFYEVPITLTYQGQSETGTIFASKDGKYVLRGEMFNTSEDPFAVNRAALSLENSPSLGPANAKVTLVEFSDFQCPHCRLAYQALKALLPKFPQVRVVYKNFPLENIHPWAMMAAVGSRCAYQNSNAAFWKMYDSIFDQQDVISAENVYDKLTDFAGAAGISADAFHTCLNDPASKQAIDADLQLGEKLDINSTPTIFINGRRVVGGDPASLEQLLTFELNRK